MVEASSDNNPRRIIFLDCDGVLASFRCNMESYTEENKADLILDPNDDCTPLEKFNVEQLVNLVNTVATPEIPVNIVLSTTWRLQEKLRHFLADIVLTEQYGLTVEGDTPLQGISGTHRGAQIRSWLESHPTGVIGFVVLDDSFADQFQAMLPAGHFVETVLRKHWLKDKGKDFFDPEAEGLTATKVEEAVHALMKPYSVSEL